MNSTGYDLTSIEKTISLSSTQFDEFLEFVIDKKKSTKGNEYRLWLTIYKNLIKNIT